MRIEVVNNRRLLCGPPLKLEQLAPGQVWAAASGADHTVRIVAIDGEWVLYEWEEGAEVRQHEKDAFSFQSRYCLVIGEEQ
jgi:hypothetical protein